MKDFFKIFGFFYKTYPAQTVTVVLLIIMAGLAEALGVMAFLPFFQIVLDGESDLGHLPEGWLKDFITGSGIPISFGSVSIFIIAAIGLKGLILWLALRKVGHTVARISADLRTRLLNGLLHANWRYFVGSTLGTNLNAMINETIRSSAAFVSTARFISAIVQFVIYATGAFLLSPVVFFGALTIGLVLVAALWTLVKVARKAGNRQTKLAKNMLNHMADMLQGIKPLRAMALENKFMGLLSSHLKGLQKAEADQMISAQSLRVFHEPLMVLTAITGLYLAITFGDLTSSELALMAVIFIRLLTSMNSAQNEFQRLMIQESALWSLLDTIEKTEQSGDNWPGTASVPKNIDKIEISNVNFSHGEKTILSNASLEFAPKTMTALIGESGSGKTTLLDLLSCFYLPDSGSIAVNDQGLDILDLGLWRKTIGFVPQEVFLFNETILENILVGRPDISEEDVWQALEAAGAKDFVESLPNGLHAPVGENGRMLSGGQRQRIAIARAIVHKPQLLLLDEATSALDAETETILLKTLQKLAKDIMVVFVSHNATVQDYADAVYKIEGGQITKPRKGLLRRKG